MEEEGEIMGWWWLGLELAQRGKALATINGDRGVNKIGEEGEVVCAVDCQHGEGSVDLVGGGEEIAEEDGGQR